jgi:tRNA threonylcarbamoyl adenosine modification protein YeaZ
VRLALAIDTSSVTYAVAIGISEDVLVHRTVRRDDPSFRGIGDLVSSSLASINGSFTDIECVALDVGPGSLASARAATAYANGLAFGLGIGIYCASSLEIMAADAREIDARAALCVRNAGGGNVYAGLFDPGSRPQLRHGQLESVIPAMTADVTEISVAGWHRREIADLLPLVNVKDTGIEYPSVLTLYKMLKTEGDRIGSLVSLASPLNEGSAVFHE